MDMDLNSQTNASRSGRCHQDPRLVMHRESGCGNTDASRSEPGRLPGASEPRESDELASKRAGLFDQLAGTSLLQYRSEQYRCKVLGKDPAQVLGDGGPVQGTALEKNAGTSQKVAEKGVSHSPDREPLLEKIIDMSATTFNAWLKSSSIVSKPQATKMPDAVDQHFPDRLQTAVDPHLSAKHPPKPLRDSQDMQEQANQSRSHNSRSDNHRSPCHPTRLPWPPDSSPSSPTSSPTAACGQDSPEYIPPYSPGFTPIDRDVIESTNPLRYRRRSLSPMDSYEAREERRRALFKSPTPEMSSPEYSSRWGDSCESRHVDSDERFTTTDSCDDQPSSSEIHMERIKLKMEWDRLQQERETLLDFRSRLGLDLPPGTSPSSDVPSRLDRCQKPCEQVSPPSGCSYATILSKTKHTRSASTDHHKKLEHTSPNHCEPHPMPAKKRSQSFHAEEKNSAHSVKKGTLIDPRQLPDIDKQSRHDKVDMQHSGKDVASTINSLPKVSTSGKQSRVRRSKYGKSDGLDHEVASYSKSKKPLTSSEPTRLPKDKIKAVKTSCMSESRGRPHSRSINNSAKHTTDNHDKRRGSNSRSKSWSSSRSTSPVCSSDSLPISPRKVKSQVHVVLKHKVTNHQSDSHSGSSIPSERTHRHDTPSNPSVDTIDRKHRNFPHSSDHHRHSSTRNHGSDKQSGSRSHSHEKQRSEESRRQPTGLRKHKGSQSREKKPSTNQGKSSDTRERSEMSPRKTSSLLAEKRSLHCRRYSPSTDKSKGSASKDTCIPCSSGTPVMDPLSSSNSSDKNCSKIQETVVKSFKVATSNKGKELGKKKHISSSSSKQNEGTHPAEQSSNHMLQQNQAAMVVSLVKKNMHISSLLKKDSGNNDVSAIGKEISNTKDGVRRMRKKSSGTLQGASCNILVQNMESVGKGTWSQEEPLKSVRTIDSEISCQGLLHEPIEHGIALDFELTGNKTLSHTEFVTYSSGMTCPVKDCVSDECYSSKKEFDCHWRSFHCPMVQRYSCSFCHGSKYAPQPSQAWELTKHFQDSHPLVKFLPVNTATTEKLLVCVPQTNPLYIHPEYFVYKCQPMPPCMLRPPTEADLKSKLCENVKFVPGMPCPVSGCSDKHWEDEVSFAAHWTDHHISSDYGPCILCIAKKKMTKFELKDHRKIRAHYALEHTDVGARDVDVHALLYCKQQRQLDSVVFRDPEGLIYSSPSTGEHKTKHCLNLLLSSTDTLKSNTEVLASDGEIYENVLARSSVTTSITERSSDELEGNLKQVPAQLAAGLSASVLSIPTLFEDQDVSNMLTAYRDPLAEKHCSQSEHCPKWVCPEKSCCKITGFETIAQFTDHWFNWHVNNDYGPCLLCMIDNSVVSVESRKWTIWEHLKKYHPEHSFVNKPLKWFLLHGNAGNYVEEKDAVLALTDEAMFPMQETRSRKQAEQVHFRPGMFCPVVGCIVKPWACEKLFADHWTDVHLSSTSGPCIVCLLNGLTEVFVLPGLESSNCMTSNVASHFSLKHKEICLENRSVYEVLLIKRPQPGITCSHIKPAPSFYSSENTGNVDSHDNLLSLTMMTFTKFEFKPGTACPVGFCSKIKFMDERVFAAHWTTYHLSDKLGPCVLCAENQQMKKFALLDHRRILAHYKSNHPEVSVDGVDVCTLLYCKREQGFDKAEYHDPGGLIYSSPSTGDGKARSWWKSAVNASVETACEDNMEEEAMDLDAEDDIEKSGICVNQNPRSFDWPSGPMFESASSAPIVDAKKDPLTSQQVIKTTMDQPRSITHVFFVKGMPCPVCNCPVKYKFLEEMSFGVHWTDYHLESNCGPCTICIKNNKRVIFDLILNQNALKKHYDDEHQWVDQKRYPLEALILCKYPSQKKDTFKLPGVYHYSSHFTGDQAGRYMLEDLGESGNNISDTENWLPETMATKKDFSQEAYLNSSVLVLSCPVKSCTVSGMSCKDDIEAHIKAQHAENVQQYVCLICERSGNTRCNPIRKLPWSMRQHLGWSHDIFPSPMEEKHDLFPKCFIRVEFVHNVAYWENTDNDSKYHIQTQYKHSISAQQHTTYLNEIPLELERGLTCPVTDCQYKPSMNYDENREHWISTHASDCVNYICRVCGFIQGKAMFPKLIKESFGAMREHFHEYHPWLDPCTVTEGHLNTTHVMAELVPNVPLIKRGLILSNIHKTDSSCAIRVDEENWTTAGARCPVPTCPTLQRFCSLNAYICHWNEVHTPWVIDGMRCVICHMNEIIYHAKHMREMRRHLAVRHGQNVVSNPALPLPRKQAKFVVVYNSKYINPSPLSLSSFENIMKPHKSIVVDGELNFFKDVPCAVGTCGVKSKTRKLFETHWLSVHCPGVKYCICKRCEPWTLLMSGGQVFSVDRIIDHYKHSHPMEAWLYEDMIIVPPTSIVVKWQEITGRIYSYLRIKGLPCSELAPKHDGFITFPVMRTQSVIEQIPMSKTDGLQTRSANPGCHVLEDEKRNSYLSTSSHLADLPHKSEAAGLTVSKAEQRTTCAAITAKKTAALEKSSHKVCQKKSGEALTAITLDVSEDVMMKYDVAHVSSANASCRKPVSFDQDTTCPVSKCASKKLSVNHWCQYHMLLRGFYCLLCVGKAAKTIHPGWLIRSHLRNVHPSLRAITERFVIPENIVKRLLIPGVHYIDPFPYFIKGELEAVLTNCVREHYYDSTNCRETTMRPDWEKWLIAESPVAAPSRAPITSEVGEPKCPAFQCQHLPSFHNHQQLSVHWEFRHTSVLSKYTCETCQISVLGYEALKRHCRKCHVRQRMDDLASQLVLERVPSPFFLHPGDANIKTQSDDFHFKSRYQTEKSPPMRESQVVVVYDSNMLCPVAGCSAQKRYPTVEMFDNHWMSSHHPASTEYICWICGSYWLGLNSTDHLAKVHPEIDHREIAKTGGLGMLIFTVSSPQSTRNGSYVYFPTCGLSLINPVSVSIDLSKDSVDIMDPNTKSTFTKGAIKLKFVKNMRCPVPGCLSIAVFDCREQFDQHWIHYHTALRDLYACSYCGGGDDSDGWAQCVFNSKIQLRLHMVVTHKGKNYKRSNKKAPSLFFVDPWCFHYVPSASSGASPLACAAGGDNVRKRPAADECPKVSSAKRRKDVPP